ncbi:hypothetical protein GF391_03645 [Candidatus Uhrbacteria bacterium]|nr:hypothetical protein [Candidatus Uhrbacteria bacterium]
MFLAQLKSYEMKVDNIFIILLASRMVSVFLITTMFAPFQKSIGISLHQMAILEGLFQLIWFAMEVPTGIIADKKGRSWSIKIGTALFGIGIFSYAFAFNFLSALFAEMFIATGMAFISGADDAWLADALDRQDRLNDFGEIKSKAVKWMGVTALISGSLGALIADFVGYRYVWLLGSVALAFSYFIAHWQINGQGEVIVNQNKKVTKRHKMLGTMQAGYYAWRASWPLKWTTLALCFFTLSFAFNHFWPVYLREISGDQKYLSGIWILIYSMTMIGPWVLSRCYKRANQDKQKGESKSLTISKRGIVLALLMSGSGLALAGYASHLSPVLLFCCVHELGRGLIGPSADPYIQRFIKSEYRATYKSMQTMTTSLTSFCLYLLMSYILRGKPANADSVGYLWMLMGGTLIALTLLIFLIRPREPRRH